MFNMNKTNLHTNDFHIIKAIVENIQDQQGRSDKIRIFTSAQQWSYQDITISINVSCVIHIQGKTVIGLSRLSYDTGQIVLSQQFNIISSFRQYNIILCSVRMLNSLSTYLPNHTKINGSVVFTRKIYFSWSVKSTKSVSTSYFLVKNIFLLSSYSLQ